MLFILKIEKKKSKPRLKLFCQNIFNLSFSSYAM